MNVRPLNDSLQVERSYRITALVTLPPPRTGQTAVSKAVVEEFRNRAVLRMYDWSGGGATSGIRWKIRKAWRNLASVAWLLAGNALPGESLYVVANDGLGLIYNCLQVMSARIRGFKLVIHHHSFAYLHKKDWLMRCMTKIAGKDAVHILLGPEMRERFVSLYGPQVTTREVPNYFLLCSQSPSTASARFSVPKEAWNGRGPLRIGHLSNLSLEKGVGRVIETFDLLRERRHDVELHLAGPATSPVVVKLLEDCKSRYGDRAIIYGPVFEQAKAEFLSKVDVFLFPTLYRTEAQPLVVIEAILAQVPVITTDIACLPSLVGSDGGLLISRSSCWSSNCAETIEQWFNHPEVFATLVNSTTRRSDEIRRMASESLETLMDACGI